MSIVSLKLLVLHFCEGEKMIQEYLFTDLSNYETIKEQKMNKVSASFQIINGTDNFIVRYCVDGENEENAKLLSKINENIVTSFSPTVLTDESSAYFNKKLFPYINEFERKLRKLLYLKSAINKSKKSFDNIKDLEQKDLGEIFDLLFTDENFVKNVKGKVNEKTWRYTKKEIIASIQNIKEDAVWDLLMCEDAIPTLRNNYILVKMYRNDVMHAHNISLKRFSESKKMFKEINAQLDDEIAKIITYPLKAKKENMEMRFDETLGEAIAKMQKDTKELRESYGFVDEIKNALQSPLMKEVNESRAIIDSLKQLIEKK